MVSIPPYVKDVHLNARVVQTHLAAPVVSLVCFYTKRSAFRIVHKDFTQKISQRLARRVVRLVNRVLARRRLVQNVDHQKSFSRINVWTNVRRECFYRKSSIGVCRVMLHAQRVLELVEVGVLCVNQN